MTPDELRVQLFESVTRFLGDTDVTAPALDALVLERPKSRLHGDYASNVALVIASQLARPPREVAEGIAVELRVINGISDVDVAGPGFINITLDAAAQGQTARIIVERGPEFGHSGVLQSESINVEFISANPTGPLHLGHTRWAAVGDALARVLAACGAEVAREFYINDRGVQMEKFAASVMAAAHGQAPPTDGYHGDYVAELGAKVVDQVSGVLDYPEDKQLAAFREAAYQIQLREQQHVLEHFRTHFDVWCSERELHSSGAVERGLQTLREQGHVFETEGAVWLRTTDFGDDKDRVLIKADGEYTYFASDIAYYVDKRSRGFDVSIYLLGADHHGYVNRLRAVAACAGDDMDRNIEVLIGQLVKITRGGKEIKLSKRDGTIVTLEELVSEVGVDAARYTLIRYPVDSPLTLDLDTMIRQTNENPVFYVQYAHARISSVLRNAADMSIDWRNSSFEPQLLTHEREDDLLGRLAQFPSVVSSAGELREPHRICRYLEDLATSYHRFYDVCWVLPRGDEAVTDSHIARLWLCAAARQVFANGLDLLGVAAPERM